MKRFRSILFLLATALLFGVVPARAYLLAVEVLWTLPADPVYDPDNPDYAANNGYNNSYHLQLDSIIQLVAYNSNDMGVSGFGPDQLDPNKPGDNFTHYSGDGEAPYVGDDDADVYIADTTPAGHHIVGTGYLQPLTEYGNGVYGITAIINVPDAYDTVYVRVFSATEFQQGVVSTNVYWGISPTNHIDPTFGTALTWFDDVETPNLANFELIPEPSSLAFLLSGGCGMGVFSLFRRRRKLRPPEE